MTSRIYFELDFLYKDEDEKEHWYSDVIEKLPIKEDFISYLQAKYPAIIVKELGKLKKVEVIITEISHEGRATN